MLSILIQKLPSFKGNSHSTQTPLPVSPASFKLLQIHDPRCLLLFVIFIEPIAASLNYIKSSTILTIRVRSIVRSLVNRFISLIFAV